MDPWTSSSGIVYLQGVETSQIMVAYWHWLLGHMILEPVVVPRPLNVGNMREWCPIYMIWGSLESSMWIGKHLPKHVNTRWFAKHVNITWLDCLGFNGHSSRMVKNQHTKQLGENDNHLWEYVLGYHGVYVGYIYLTDMLYSAISVSLIVGVESLEYSHTYHLCN